MGRVRTKLIKRASRTIIEKYYPRLTLDFDTNKKVAEEVAVIPSKRVRNKIAGFVTHLMKRIQRGGSVRGISLKLQEEERERRLDFLPERSVLDMEVVDIDEDTFDLLRALEFEDMAGIHRVPLNAPGQHQVGAGGRGGGGAGRDRSGPQGNRQQRGEKKDQGERPQGERRNRGEKTPAAAPLNA